MADPRPFGTGPYGVGYYSVYRGAVWDVAGRTSITLLPQASGQLTFSAAGAAELRTNAWTWGLQRERDLAGRTQILLTARSHGIQRTINPHGTAQIVFSVWAKNLEYSWALPAPCEPGVWTPAAPCELGVWTPPPGGLPGAWTPVRLPGL